MTATLVVPSRSGSPVDERVLTFVRPIIGFGGSARYRLCGLGETYAPFAALSSVDEEGLAFVVVAPGALFDDYVIEIPEAEAALLELVSPEDVEVLTLVTRRLGASPVANLMGPVVVNRQTLQACQVVLQNAPYGVAVPVDAGSARASSAVSPGDGAAGGARARD